VSARLRKDGSGWVVEILRKRGKSKLVPVGAQRILTADRDSVRLAIKALEEEYKAKAPSFRWDIKHFEAEISKRNEEMAFLEDITNVMTEEEISEMNNVVERISGSLEALQNSGIVSQETFTKVKTSLEGTIENLKELKCIL